MSVCSICDGAIEGPRLADPSTGDHYHAACFANHVPEDALAALIAASVLLFAPLIVVWAA